MTLIMHRNRTIAKDAMATLKISAIVNASRKAAAWCSRYFVRAVEAYAEARLQKAILEAELYQRRYKISSKNDDDLPIVR